MSIFRSHLRPRLFQRILVPHRSLLSTSLTRHDIPTPSKPMEGYKGPLTLTFRRLKIFSASSFAMSATLAPFIFVVESSLPISARIALASIAVGTSGISTGLIAWCGKPYVNTLRPLTHEEDGGAGGIEMTTSTFLLNTRVTKVYDPAFLIETRRPFAKWELADKIVLSDNKSVKPGQEETVAETTDKDGRVLGRWIVEWGEGGEGRCRPVGNIIRHFNVHEELVH